MQDKIGEEFKSIQPDYSNFENINNATEGAVYDGDGGLFASDRRANRVGDIITITLEETLTAQILDLKHLQKVMRIHSIFLKLYLVHLL